MLKKYLAPQSPADFYGFLMMLIGLLTLVVMLVQEHQSLSPTTEIVNQLAAIVKQYHCVAQQAPPLLGAAANWPGGNVIRR